MSRSFRGVKALAKCLVSRCSAVGFCSAPAIIIEGCFSLRKYPAQKSRCVGIRFSLGRSATEADVDAVLAVLPTIVNRVRKHK